MVLNDMSYDSVKTRFEKRGMLKCFEVVSALESLRSKKEKVLIIKSLNMMNFPDLQPALLTVDTGKMVKLNDPIYAKSLKFSGITRTN